MIVSVRDVACHGDRSLRAIHLALRSIASSQIA